MPNCILDDFLLWQNCIFFTQHTVMWHHAAFLLFWKFFSFTPRMITTKIFYYKNKRKNSAYIFLNVKVLLKIWKHIFYLTESMFLDAKYFLELFDFITLQTILKSILLLQNFFLLTQLTVKSHYADFILFFQLRSFTARMISTKIFYVKIKNLVYLYFHST